MSKLVQKFRGSVQVVFSLASKFRAMEQVSAAFDACKEAMLLALGQQQAAMVTFMAEVRQEIAAQNQQISWQIQDLRLCMTEAARAKDVELQTLRLEAKKSEDRARICGILDQTEIRGFASELQMMQTFLAKKFPDQKDIGVQIDPEMDEDNEYRTKMEVLARVTLQSVYGKVIASLKLEEEKREEDRQTAETHHQQFDRGEYQGYAARRQASHISLWKCCLRYGLEIRSSKTFGREDSQGHLGEGEIFEVSQEVPLRDGSGFFLRLADGRGWAFSNSRKLGKCCVPAQARPSSDDGAPNPPDPSNAWNGWNGWNGWRSQPSSNHDGNTSDWWKNENGAGQWQGSAWNTPSWWASAASSEG